MKIQSLKELEAEMRAVARGKKKAPADAAMPSFESVEGLIRLLTPSNRILMKIIRDKKPKSVAELSRLAKRAEPNLLRTLAKLAAFGLLEIKTVNRRKVPISKIGKLRVEINPYAMTDRVIAH